MPGWFDLVTVSATGSHVLPVLLDAAVKSLIVLVPAVVATAVMRRSSAAARHLVWFLAVAGLLILPVLSATLPGWQILPRWVDLSADAAPDVASLRPPETESPAPVALASSDQLAGPDDSFEPTTEPPAAIGEVEATNREIGAGERSVGATAVLPSKPRPDDGPGRGQAYLLAAWVPLVWMTGTLLVLWWLCLGIISMRRLGRRSELITDGSWAGLRSKLSAELKLKRSVHLLQSDRRSMPMAWGLFKPRLLLPAEALTWPADRRRVVLLHELAHIRRRDPLTQFITQIACALYWFNPLVWLAARRMVTERERACDDLVLAAGSPPCDYADHVLQIASSLRSNRLVGAAAIAMARPSSLEGRLLAILDTKRRRRVLTPTAAVLLVIASAAIILPVGTMRAMGSDPEPKPDTPTGADSRVGSQADSTAPPASSIDAAASGPQVTGVVVDEAGKPVGGAVVGFMRGWATGKTVTTAKDGTFALVSEDASLRLTHVLAVADNRKKQGIHSFGPGVPDATTRASAKITMKPSQQVRVQVVDDSGKPVSDAWVGLTGDLAAAPVHSGKTDADGVFLLWAPVDAKPAPMDAKPGSVAAFKAGMGFDYSEGYRFGPPTPEGRPRLLPEQIKLVLDGARQVRVRAVDSDGQPLSNVSIVPTGIRKPGKRWPADVSASQLGVQVTNAEGVASFDWLPDSGQDVRFRCHDYGRLYVPEEVLLPPGGSETELTARLRRMARVEGKVRLPDGTPARGVLIQVHSDRDGLNINCAYARTTADGSYSVTLHPGQSHIITVFDDGWAAPSRVGAPLREAEFRSGLDFQLVKGTLIRGTVTSMSDGRALAGEQISLMRIGPELPQDLGSGALRRLHEWRQTRSDERGQYSFRVGPGDYEMGGSDPIKREHLTIATEKEIIHNFTFDRPDRKPLDGLVVNKTNGEKPASGVIIHSVSTARTYQNGRELKAVTDGQGRFKAMREVGPMIVYARDAAGLLVACVSVNDRQDSVTIPLVPGAKATGRVVDETGKPLAGRDVVLTMSIRVGDASVQLPEFSHGAYRSYEDGTFSIPGLPDGARCSVSLSDPARQVAEHVYDFNVRGSDNIEIPDLVIGAKGRIPGTRPTGVPTTQRTRGQEAEAERADQGDDKTKWSDVVNLLSAGDAPAQFDAWSLHWKTPSIEHGAKLQYRVIEPDGKEHYRQEVDPDKAIRSDFQPGLAGGDPAAFFGKPIVFQIRVSEGLMHLSPVGKFELQFFKHGSDGKIKWQNPLARIGLRPRPAGVYYVSGHVQRPGPYALAADAYVSLARAIAAAGGLVGNTSASRVVIVSRVDAKDVRREYDLEAILGGRASDPEIRPHDRVRVGEADEGSAARAASPIDIEQRTSPMSSLGRAAALSQAGPGTSLPSEQILLDAFEKGRSLVIAEVLAVRSVPELPGGVKAHYYRARIVRTVVAGDLSAAELAEPVDLYGGAWGPPAGETLKPGATYALFITKERPYQLAWAHRSDFVRVDLADGPSIEAVVCAATQAYEKTAVRGFRMAEIADKPALPELSKPMVAAFDAFRAHPRDRIKAAGTISGSDFGSHMDPDVAILESSEERYLPPKIRLSRAQVVFLLGEPTVRSEWTYLWYCGEAGTNTRGERLVGVLSVRFDRKEDVARLVYETQESVGWLRDEPADAKPQKTQSSRPQVSLPASFPRARSSISLLPGHAVVPSLKELELLAYAHVAEDSDPMLKTGDWEIRIADQARRVAILPAEWLGVSVPTAPRPGLPRLRTGRLHLSAEAVRQAGDLRPGEYLLAWVVAGQRVSNVVSFRIGPNDDAKGRPLLEIEAVEAPPGQALPLLGIRARRDREADPAPKFSDVAFPELTIDGQPRRWKTMAWAGPDRPLKVGEQATYLKDLANNLDPPVDPGQTHDVSATIGSLHSARIRLVARDKEETAWDQATPKLGPIPQPEVSLRGRVIGPDGSPGAGYQVYVEAEAMRGKLGELPHVGTDDQGRYVFRNLPPGKCEVWTNPSGMGQPSLRVKEVVLAPGKTHELDLDLTAHFQIGGKVVDAKGKPVSGREVMSTWRSADGQQEFEQFGTTDAQGKYQIGSPLPIASYVGLSGTGEQPKPYHDVQAPSDKLDFVVK